MIVRDSAGLPGWGPLLAILASGLALFGLALCILCELGWGGQNLGGSARALSL